MPRKLDDLEHLPPGLATFVVVSAIVAAVVFVVLGLYLHWRRKVSKEAANAKRAARRGQARKKRR